MRGGPLSVPAATLLLASAGWGQIAPVTSLEGVAGAVAFHEIAGRRLLLQARGGTLEIHGMEDPGRPAFLGRLVLYQEIVDISAQGSLAAVSKGDDGLSLVDISDPSRPRLLASPPAIHKARAACIAGGRLYVAAADSGLQVLDIGEPADPVLLGTYREFSRQPHGAANDVVVRGSLAYVAAGDSGLLILDVSSPARPRRRGRFPTSSRSFSVALEGDKAHLADGSLGLLVVDVSDPDSPQGYPRPDYNLAFDAVVSGATVCLAGAPARVLDASDPAAPLELLRIDDWGTSARAAFDRGLLALATPERGIALLDLSDPAAPKRLPPLATLGEVYGVSAGRRVAILRGRDGQAGYDMAEPAKPVPIPAFDAGAVLIQGDMAYATGEPRSPTGRAWNLADPAGPVPTDDAIAWGEVVHLHGAGKLLAATREDSTLLYDLSEPARPVRRGALPREGADFPLVGDGFLAAAGPGPRVSLADLADPSRPVHREALETGMVRDLWVEGRNLYVTDGTTAVRYALDASLRPASTLRMSVPGGAGQVARYGPLLVVANATGLMAADTGSAAEAGSWRRVLAFAGDAADIQVAEGRLYVASRAGLFVFDRPPAAALRSVRRGPSRAKPLAARDGSPLFPRGGSAADALGRSRRPGSR